MSKNKKKMLKKYKEFNENIDWEFDEDESEIHEFIGHEDFYNFLVDHDILDKYINSYYESRFVKISIKEMLDSNGIINYIDSFTWHNTKEGHKFWLKVNEKWISHVL